MINEENISTKMDNRGNRRLPLTYEKGTVFTEDAEVTGNDFAMICHSYRTEQSGFVFIPHMHELFEILYVERGRPQFFAGGKRYDCESGDFMVFNSMDIHACLYAEAPYKSRTVQFGSGMVSSKYADVCDHKYIQPLFQKKISFTPRITGDETLYDLFAAVEEEYYGQKPGYELAAKGLLLSLLTHLYRHHLEKSERPSNAMNSELNQNRFNYIVDYIGQHYTEEIRIDELTKALFIDRSYVSRIFKQHAGKTILEYANSLRIMNATNLLKETDLSISEIALQVGFSDINYFSRMYKKLMGINPAAVRAAHKNRPPQ